MTTAVIEAHGISKRYERGALSSSVLLRDILARTLRAPWTLFQRQKPDTFWALNDVSLQVGEGEVLGLIGRNGCGKTTLLKILSRITRPTSGWAEIHGRVGSLLEVGTGFHPELTGRENAYLSGAILGMSKREIVAKFDEIVAFAELEKFIDTPVKHYSSGMYVRLAFAVAAHLEPEILLVDEVLAVGDINFQKKCLGKMGDVARAGRTIVLVSHQLNQIRRLCNRTVWVDSGEVRHTGPTAEVVSAYETAMSAGDTDDTQRYGARANSKGRFLHWQLEEHGGNQPHILSSPGPISVCFRLEISKPIRRGVHGVALYNSDRQTIWGTAAYNLDLAPGVHVFRHSFPSLPLRPGPYKWLVSLFDEAEELDMWDAVPELIVATENYQHPRDEWSGILNLPSKFSLQKEPVGNA